MQARKSISKPPRASLTRGSENPGTAGIGGGGGGGGGTGFSSAKSGNGGGVGIFGNGTSGAFHLVFIHMAAVVLFFLTPVLAMAYMANKAPAASSGHGVQLPERHSRRLLQHLMCN